MVQERFYSIDSLITSIVEKVTESNKKYVLTQYIRETLEKCNDLCQMGQEVRALIEIKYLIINLKKQLNL